MHTLLDLLARVEHTPQGDLSVPIANVAYDSRRVAPGTLFVAIRGTHTDGHAYIRQALDNGAVAVVYDDADQPPPPGVPAALVADAKVALSPISAAFHGYPAHQLEVIGITGSKGKTTTTFLTAAALEASGEQVGFMSTVDFKIGARQWSNDTRQSTPESLEIQAMLRQMADAGCRYAVVESTSHGLSPRWNRLGDCAYDIALITNVTREHLDYHGSVEQYRQDKAELFRLLAASPREKQIAGQAVRPRKVAIVNADDPYAQLFRDSAGPEVEQFSYAIHADADVRASQIESTSRGLRFVAETPAGTYRLNLQLVGTFYVYNVLAALSVCVARGIDLAAAIARLEAISGISGRMDQVSQGQPFSVLVDYAHNPDSFEQVMGMMRPLTEGRLIAVFGSAGERDRGKRAIQGEIAGRWCDLLYLTDEDPRGESGQAILEEIAAGAEAAGKRIGVDCFLIADRRAAIRAALGAALPGDVVMLLGKGHEGSIIYADGSLPWNEREVACAELTRLGYEGVPS
ncbi:MAG TPA: UDP-N-acetylmuramoyl-L-alanyl-D-glutamate--2,6-diaminopimelate ligase [Herpetosiphonaceae bacterium]|nr:UDP-N-acetylmuramoyl-L-alanyl-D-glutamate--2,6-diaminopimelate ligase [Herpetosiphonaceae bacterium]